MPHALALLTALAAAALPAGELTLNPAASTIRCTVVHKLHRVAGSSTELEGKAVVKEDGTVLAMVRAPMTSFHSGVSNRDEHMLEAVEAGKHSHVTVKGIVRLGPGRELPASPPTMEGEVDLHGVKRPVSVPLAIAHQPDGSVRAQGRFEVSLEAHGVERPSLLFVKIDDACRIEVDLVLRGRQ